jgi:hypothetical protein
MKLFVTLLGLVLCVAYGELREIVCRESDRGKSATFHSQGNWDSVMTDCSMAR